MTTETRTCPRCAPVYDAIKKAVPRLYDNDDGNSTYRECITCGYTEEIGFIKPYTVNRERGYSLLPYSGVTRSFQRLRMTVHIGYVTRMSNFSEAGEFEVRTFYCPMPAGEVQCNREMKSVQSYIDKSTGMRVQIRQLMCPTKHIVYVEDNVTWRSEVRHD